MKFSSQFCFYFSIIFYFISPISAQILKKETPQYKNAFKGYLNLLKDKKTTVLTDDIGNTRTIIDSKTTFLPAIGWTKFKKNGRFTEMGITQLNFNYEFKKSESKYLFQRDSFGNIVPVNIDVPSRETETWTNTIGLRFEWNFPFFHEENNRLQSFFGISTDPSLFYQKINTVFTSFFPSRIFELSNTITIIPRVTYALSNRFFLDINAPISFINLSVNYKIDKNPTLPHYLRETVNFNAHLPTNIWAIRFGIGYKI